jgi:hypothetical protein
MKTVRTGHASPVAVDRTVPRLPSAVLGPTARRKRGLVLHHAPNQSLDAVAAHALSRRRLDNRVGVHNHSPSPRPHLVRGRLDLGLS